jgi:hypothetical protein
LLFMVDRVVLLSHAWVESWLGYDFDIFNCGRVCLGAIE